MARTVDDILSRRTRSLLFDASAASEAADSVAQIVAQDLGRDAGWIDTQIAEFRELAKAYSVPENAVG